MSMRKKRLSFEGQLRNLIEMSGQSCYAICKATAIDKATMSRFLNHKGGLSMPNLNLLTEHFGWIVISEKQTTRNAGE